MFRFAVSSLATIMVMWLLCPQLLCKQTHKVVFNFENRSNIVFISRLIFKNSLRWFILKFSLIGDMIDIHTLYYLLNWKWNWIYENEYFIIHSDISNKREKSNAFVFYNFWEIILWLFGNHFNAHVLVHNLDSVTHKFINLFYRLQHISNI